MLETDPWGNFLISGYDYGTARNWARLGLLYLRDGVWNGQRLLPEGFTKFVSTPAPAWRRPEYGGQFWINGIGHWNLPRDAYFMSGAGGQHTFIVPSHDLVVVRMGHQRGSQVGSKLLNQSLRRVAGGREVRRRVTREEELPRGYERPGRIATSWFSKFTTWCPSEPASSRAEMGREDCRADRQSRCRQEVEHELIQIDHKGERGGEVAPTRGRGGRRRASPNRCRKRR